jgi:hypothetical protein
MRGRKPKGESRATDIRASLVIWKRTPEYSRPSLRALARELSTSHQLLSHYLKQWDKWQAEEYRREGNEIRARVEAEGRPATLGEEQRINVCRDQAVYWSLSAALNDRFRKLSHQARGGHLPASGVKMLRGFAKAGYHEAPEILEKLRSAEKSKNNLPVFTSIAAKSFRSVKDVPGNSAKTLVR